MLGKLFLCFSWCFCISVFAEGKVIYQNDFSSATRYEGEWFSTDGSWTVDSVSGVLRQQIGAPHRVGRTFLMQGLPANLEITFDLTYLGGQSLRSFGCGVMLRHPGPGKEGMYYQLSIPTSGQDGLELFKINGIIADGKLTRKYQRLAMFDSPRSEQGRKCRVKISLTGNTFVCCLDGEEMFEYSHDDAQVTGRAFGFTTYGASVEIDNLTIKEIRE